MTNQSRPSDRNAQNTSFSTDQLLFRSGPATLFRGIGRLVTMAGAMAKAGRKVIPADLSVIDDAALVAQGGQVAWVGRERDLPQELRDRSSFAEVYDMNGAVVIPALIECHTHLIYDGNRAAEFERRNRGESYQSIGRSGGGILSTVNATRAASEERLAAFGEERAQRFLRQGVTTIETKSGYGLSVNEELKMLRAAGRVKSARIVRTFLGAHAIPKEAESAQAYVETLAREALPRIKAEGLACRVDIFVENGYFSKDVARAYLQAARDQGFDLVIHADQLTRCGGAELAVELGARSAEHLICIDDSDIERLAASETTCVLLPSADLYMNCAYPPARKLLDAGARVAIATDFNPGTSPSLDVALVGVLARIQMKMSLEETLTAYTVGAAYSLGLERELGSIEIGKQCDLVALTGDFEELFLEVGRMPVASVFRAGAKVMDNKI